MLYFPIFELLPLIYLLLYIRDIITLPCKPKEKVYEKFGIKVVVFTAISTEWRFTEWRPSIVILLRLYMFMFCKHFNLKHIGTQLNYHISQKKRCFADKNSCFYNHKY